MNADVTWSVGTIFLYIIKKGHGYQISDFYFHFLVKTLKKVCLNEIFEKPILLKMNHSYSNKIILFCHKTSCHVVHFVSTATR